jgi:NAD-dependent dihydropyrimidine dehydrogenase PreA subunit
MRLRLFFDGRYPRYAFPVLAEYSRPNEHRLKAPATNLTQDIYVADGLKTGRIMAKDEDVCLHCGLCAERCPTGAWDMKKYLIEMTHAGMTCQHEAQSAA